MTSHAIIRPEDAAPSRGNLLRFSTAFLTAIFCMLGSLASGQSGDLARECAMRDLDLIIALDGHRTAQDISSENLFAAFVAIQRARETCATDPVAALELYESVAFGPTLAAHRDAVWGPLD